MRKDLYKRNRGLVDHRGLWFLAFPAIVVVLIIQYMPLPGLIIAFKNYNYGLGVWDSPWSGFSNFRFLFSSGVAARITWNTIRWNVLFIVLTHSFSITIALVMNEFSSKAVKAYQTVFFFPYFISWVIAAYLGLALFSGDKGLMNQFLIFLGKDTRIWYASPRSWNVILPVAYLWKTFGYTTVIYYTALLGLDTQQYEAANIEGATTIQKAFRISIPQLKSLIVILIMMDIGRIFRSDFGLFYQFTRNNSTLYPVTDVIDTYVYRALLSLGDPGMAAAAGLYQSVVALVLVLVSNYFVSRIDEESRVF